MKTKMKLENIRWFEVIFKTGYDQWKYERIIADSMKSACRIADDTFGKGSWQYVVSI